MARSGRLKPRLGQLPVTASTTTVDHKTCCMGFPPAGLRQPSLHSDNACQSLLFWWLLVHEAFTAWCIDSALELSWNSVRGEYAACATLQNFFSSSFACSMCLRQPLTWRPVGHGCLRTYVLTDSTKHHCDSHGTAGLVHDFITNLVAGCV